MLDFPLSIAHHVLDPLHEFRAHDAHHCRFLFQAAIEDAATSHFTYFHEVFEADLDHLSNFLLVLSDFLFCGLFLGLQILLKLLL